MMNNSNSSETALLDFIAWAASKQGRIENVLNHTLPSANSTPQTLHSAMRYSALEGGKRVRALLCYAASELCNTEAKVAGLTHERTTREASSFLVGTRQSE